MYIVVDYQMTMALSNNYNKSRIVVSFRRASKLLCFKMRSLGICYDCTTTQRDSRIVRAERASERTNERTSELAGRRCKSSLANIGKICRFCMHAEIEAELVV